jgi:hypothetical protein
MHTSSPVADHEERDRNEAAFHDARIEDDGRKLGYAYASVKDLFGFTAVPREHWHGRVLELGCFKGSRALAMHGFQGRYAGIDISPAAVDHCKRLGLPANFEFRVDNANALSTVGDGEVDYAFGDGVLHHLDLESMAPALARKLSADGCARFVEPAQGNFLLRTFRKLTPHLRTPDEHPFDRASIELLQRHFKVAITHEALLRPLLPMLCFNGAWATGIARRLDRWLLRHAFYQQQDGLLLIEWRKR